METSPEEGTALSSRSSDSNNTINTGQLQQHESQANTPLLPSQHRCNGRGRFLKSSGGLKNHQRSCKSSENTELQTTVYFQTTIPTRTRESSSAPTELNVDDDPPRPFLPEIEIFSFTIESPDNIIWGNSSFKQLSSFINKTYDQVLLFRKNLFKIPSGKSGKLFINELCLWLHQFNTSSNLNSIAMKTFFILPAILLQKPSAKSKAKEHSVALIRRLDMWKNSEFDELLNEVQYIQHKFKSSKKLKSPEEVGRIFAKLIMEGKISAALKLLDNEGSNGVMTELQEKHPKAEPVSSDCLLFGPLIDVPEYVFDELYNQRVQQDLQAWMQS